MATPRFCPNKACRFHIDPDSPESAALRKRRWYKRSGTYHTKVRGVVQRYTCKVCGCGFSDQTFCLDYYVKRVIDYRRLSAAVESCAGVRACARTLGCSPDSVTNRTSRLARQCIAFHARFLNTVSQQEDVAADGFESFAVSQYYPNNIHIAVGCRSQLVYFCDYVTLRRKGRMTDYQKRVRRALEQLYRPCPQALTKSFAGLLDHLAERFCDSPHRPMVLFTDKKREYQRALSANPVLRQAKRERTFRHIRIESRAARTRENPLFPVNYFDRELRKDLAEHVRETVRFARNVNHSMERLWIYTHLHNHSKRYRINDPVSEHRTHAEQAGATPSELTGLTRHLTTRRRFLSFETLIPAQQTVWRREHRTPLKGVVKGALRQIKWLARQGEVDLREVRARVKKQRLMRETQQYLPKYALM